MFPALVRARRARVMQMGYTVQYFSTMQESTTQIAGSVSLENIFNSKPIAMKWASQPDQYLGITHSNMQTELKEMASPTAKSFVQPNKNMTIPEPESQAEGMLKKSPEPRSLAYYTRHCDIYGYVNHLALVQVCKLPRNKQWLSCRRFRQFVIASDNAELLSYYNTYSYVINCMEHSYRIFNLEYNFVFAILMCDYVTPSALLTYNTVKTLRY